jgi:hypothetical protein
LVVAGGCATGQDDEEGPTFINDWTPSEGTTGDDLPVLMRVTDPSGVFTVHIKYQFEGEEEVSAPMSSDQWEENWSFQLKLRSKPVTLQYAFRAQDKVGNWAESEVRYVSLRDNDPPEVLSDTSPGIAAPGATYMFTVHLTDNDAVGGAWVNYAFDGEAPRNLTLVPGTPYTQEVAVPVSGTTELTYWIEVVDRVGNGLRTEERTVTVVDDRVPPEFGYDSTPKEGGTGRAFTFLVEATDDIDLGEVRVLYRFGEGTIANRSLGGEGPYMLSMTLPDDFVGNLNYSFYASDAAGNQAQSTWRKAKVVDTIPPVAVAGTSIDVERGYVVIFNATASHDNIGIEEYIWMFSYGGEIITLEGATPKKHFTKLGNFNVSLIVRDKEGQEGTDNLWVNVTEKVSPHPPSSAFKVKGDKWGWSLFLVAVAILACIVLMALRQRRRRAQEPLRWPTGPRSTSRRSQEGYSSTK